MKQVKTTNKNKPIIKPVYFSRSNPKELELLTYYEDKFSSFGGIVKDLLYKGDSVWKGRSIYLPSAKAEW